MLRKVLQLKTTSLLGSPLSVISKVFEKLRIVDRLEKYGLFSDFQYGFRSSRLTADHLTVVSYKCLGFKQFGGLLELLHFLLLFISILRNFYIKVTSP